MDKGAYERSLKNLDKIAVVKKSAEIMASIVL
jgi:hypothetical protein